MDSTSLLVDPEPAARRSFREVTLRPWPCNLSRRLIATGLYGVLRIASRPGFQGAGSSGDGYRRTGGQLFAVAPAGKRLRGALSLARRQRPSLQINPKRQSWKCWVCDVGGDAFSFVMQHERIGFREALELLADKAGIAPPNRLSRAPNRAARTTSALCPGSSVGRRAISSLFVARSVAAEPAREYLASGAYGREHPAVSAGVLASGLDVAGQSRPPEFSPQVLIAAGLCGRSETSGSYYDRFRGRVIFPIRDVQGKSDRLRRPHPALAGRSEGREVRQFARDAAVPEERTSVWSERGPRGPGQGPRDRGGRGLHGHDHGSPSGRRQCGRRTGHRVGREPHPAAQAFRGPDHAGAGRRRSGPAADERDPGTVCRGPGRSADPDVASAT
jgi:hypothetical protein